MMKLLAIFLVVAVAFSGAHNHYPVCSTITKTATKYYTIPKYETTYVYETYPTKVRDYVTTYTKVPQPYQKVTSRCDYGSKHH